MQLENLLAICEKLGIDAEAEGKETMRRYQLAAQKRAAELQALTAQNITSLIDDFGTALSLTIAQEGFAIVRIEQGSADGLNDMLNHLASIDPNQILDLALDLDKGALVRGIPLDDRSHHVIVYFFAHSILQALDSPLVKLDEQIFEDTRLPTVIIVLQGGMQFRGRFLTIASLAHLNELPQVLNDVPVVSGTDQARSEAYHHLATHELNCVEYQFRHLTPLHFLTTGGQVPSDDLCAILRRHLLHLCILYTANRSIYTADRGSFDVDYTGADQTITLTLNPGGVIPDDQVLSRFALWPHGGATTDRLTVFQSVVARELATSDPQANYRAFVGQLKHILAEARWNFRVFVSRRINKHFEQVQKLAAYVAEATGKITDAIDNLTKGLTETLLATAAVVVASLLAGLAKNETQETVFRWSMWFYAGYVVVQAIYRMGSVLHSFLALKTDVQEHLERHNAVLGEPKVDSLLRPLKRHRTQFWIWYAITVVLYLALIGVILYVNFSLAPRLIRSNPVSPIPTPTP